MVTRGLALVCMRKTSRSAGCLSVGFIRVASYSWKRVFIRHTLTNIQTHLDNQVTPPFQRVLVSCKSIGIYGDEEGSMCRASTNDLTKHGELV